jgi:hypothetical protein
MPDPDPATGPDEPSAVMPSRPPEAQRVLESLASRPALLEPGLTTIDTDLLLDEGLVLDLLLLDRRGRSVVVLLGDPDLPAALGRMAAVLAALVRGRYFMDRLYRSAGLDGQLRPRFILLASRFQDPVTPLLDVLDGVDVRVLEYAQAVGADGTPQLLLKALGGAATGMGQALRTQAAVGEAPEPAPPAPAEKVGPLDTLLAELDLPALSGELCRRGHDSIRSLSQAVAVSRDGDALAFLVEEEPLARLQPLGDHLELQVAGRALEVADDESLNAALNVVFGEFFTRFARVD